MEEGLRSYLVAERQLIENLPPQYVHIAHHWLILHGRYVCTARNPKCSECGLKTACKFVRIKKKSDIQSNSWLMSSMEKYFANEVNVPITTSNIEVQKM